jgi:hypothetical protein
VCEPASIEKKRSGCVKGRYDLLAETLLASSAHRTPPVFLCVSIDCECDKGPRWKVRRPLTFEGVHVGIGERLQPLFERFGAKPTYLLSPELLRDAASVERLTSLQGCELGAHLHVELAEPGATEPEVTNAVQRDFAADVERAKLFWLTSAFGDAFGRPPRSFRAGRFGVGANTVGILEELGYSVDSSVTPHVDWSHVSPGLCFTNAPEQPYHPARDDPSRRGDGSLLEVPVTIRPPRLGALPFVGPWLERRWLRPTKNAGGELLAIARETIAEARRADSGAPVVLNAMLHNVEVVAGMSPYAATESEARRILDRLAALLDFARTEGVVSVGLADVPELLLA